nr:hypothetical protein GCM10020185_32560 [Pseudomonas brassicacearum subsp. brassicacearum]
MAVLVANGVDGAIIDALKKALKAEGAHAKVLGPTSAPVTTADGKNAGGGCVHGRLAVDCL